MPHPAPEKGSPSLSASIKDGVSHAVMMGCGETYQGLVNGFFVFTGSLAGGYAADHLPRSFCLGPWTWEPSFILLVVFLISGVIRLVAARILLREFKEVRPVEPIGHRGLIFRVSHVKPIAGVTFSLFTGLFRGERQDEKGGDPHRKEEAERRGP
jgi:hypothetical protein